LSSLIAGGESPTGRKAQQSFFGYAADSITGKAVSALVPAEFRQRHTAGFRARHGRQGVIEQSGSVMILTAHDAQWATFGAPTVSPSREMQCRTCFNGSHCSRVVS